MTEFFGMIGMVGIPTLSYPNEIYHKIIRIIIIIIMEEIYDDIIETANAAFFAISSRNKPAFRA